MQRLYKMHSATGGAGEGEGAAGGEAAGAKGTPRPGLISQKVFIKSFRKSQFPDKSINLFFMLVMMKDKLTNVCGN